jgi:2-oxoglutarate dehydrogenase E1 component
MNSDFSSYLFGANAVFIEELYQKFTQDPQAVDENWRHYFASLGDDVESVNKAVKGASWRPNGARVLGAGGPIAQTKTAQKVERASQEMVELSLKAMSLVLSYRAHGHTAVELDPLGLSPAVVADELHYAFFGIDESDLQKDVMLPQLGWPEVKLSELIAWLKRTYASRVGLEFIHLSSAQERTWFEKRLEGQGISAVVTHEERIQALYDLIEAEMFENYLHTKFPGTKRFSVEGLEGIIAALNVLVKESVKRGVQECVLGMAHRGRLNTLTKIMGKSYHAMFAEFRGELAFPKETGIPGDVKYHLGSSADVMIGGQSVHMTLAPNPSHLEVVNPVVLGKVRAKQDMRRDIERSKVLGILVHGDAAFIGQGTVMESLALGQLKTYHTGGTIHMVANNQIGFTTNFTDSRFCRYSTEIAKFIGAPVLHVNGDDAEAIVFACKLAADYRATFKKDVIIDVVGYRKYGHNEGDEPLFTQPVMYAVIKNKENPAEIYSKILTAAGIVTEQEIERKKIEFKSKLDSEFEISQTYKPKKADWLEGHWSHMQQSNVKRTDPITGVSLQILKRLGQALTVVPEGFAINAKIARQLEARKGMFESGKQLDWAAGEMLAMATLLDEGSAIRMTGQDVERGTFSHRHAVVTDQNNEARYTALNNLHHKQQAFLEIKNSNLSEFGVLGFEYGYSFTNPNVLTIWEAQFGDFANGAQVVIDQYISSAEAKWLRMSGLVLLLPHGYEGQGPEHSSARLERFLQLCSMDNMQVANPTTPASLFHLLRRQMHQPFRKPLVLMSPKSLLRHKLAVSELSEFGEDTKFSPVIAEVEKNIKYEGVRTSVLCSGKIYYDLYEKRQQLGRDDIAIIRLEQLYPFPKTVLAEELRRYPKAQVVWCQEEHANMGAYSFIAPKLEELLLDLGIKGGVKYVGRSDSASPAVGYMKLHTEEHEVIMKTIFG